MLQKDFDFITQINVKEFKIIVPLKDAKEKKGKSNDSEESRVAQIEVLDVDGEPFPVEGDTIHVR